MALSLVEDGGGLRLDTGTADEWSTDDTGQPKFLRRRRPKQWFSLTAGLLLLLFSCRSVESVEVLPARAVFVVEVAGLERFKVELHEAGLIAAATALLGSGERAGVAGDLVAGDGGFNPPYHWHLAPASVQFAMSRNETLDAMPSDVEEQIQHWLGDLKQYCPWASRIVAREK